MKSIFDKETREALIVRINTLNENSAAQWGKMNVAQMLKHCILWEKMISGEIKCKRVFLGRIVGKMALKGALKGDKPMMRNAPTSPELIVKESDGDIASQKKEWVTLIEQNSHYPETYFMHPFFGKMTREQLGYHAYMHTDHHLRQFGA
jgi:hypothetical protein